MRYIDADAFEQRLTDKDIFFPALYKNELDEMPTADVVPKSEVEQIFEEIEKLSHRFMNDKLYIFADMMLDIAELKKKYTEGNNA